MSKAQPRSYSELYGNRETPISSAQTQAPATPFGRKTDEVAPQRGSDSVDWKGEYSQVFGDVRQLLVISALLFALMIVLGYLL
ncbi:MAG: hypothetical protein DWI57_07270 [Chloroflexi bacterium]|nr:MAG: hypothetical protein DWI57_07270 [Chloroflexota bacterium]